MNGEQVIIALDIMDKLKERPIWNIFENSYLESISTQKKPISLSSIRDKVANRLYTSPYQWEFEMRKTFQSYIDFYENEEIKRLSFEELRDYFEQLVSNSCIEDMHLTIELNSCKQQIHKYLEKKKTNETIPFSKDLTNKQPGSEMFQDISNTNSNMDITRLQRDIKMLRNPEFILRISSFIRKFQPDAISLDDKLAIHFDLLKPENIMKVREYVTELMRKAAIGEINPFN